MMRNKFVAIIKLTMILNKSNKCILHSNNMIGAGCKQIPLKLPQKTPSTSGLKEV